MQWKQERGAHRNTATGGVHGVNKNARTSASSATWWSRELIVGARCRRLSSASARRMPR